MLPPVLRHLQRFLRTVGASIRRAPRHPEISPSLLHLIAPTPHAERIAFHDRRDERGESVITSRNYRADLPDRAGIVVFEAATERLELLADEDGVWRCRTTFNCVEACPRGINITKAILEVSAAIGART